MTTDALRSTTAPMPDRLAADTPPRFATRTALTALGLGVAGNLLLRGGGPPGLGFGIWVAAIVFALELLSRQRGHEWTLTQRLLIVPILFFAEALAWRDGEFLILLNVAAGILAAAVLSASLYYGDAWDAARARLRDYIEACFDTWLGAAGGAVSLLIAAHAERSPAPVSARQRTVRAIARGVALAAPLLLLFGALLMSADPVFARLVTDVLSFDISTILSHVFLTLVLAWPVAGWLRGTLLSRTTVITAARPSGFTIGLVETAAVLGTLDALFASFVAVQARFMFGGDALVRATAGMTYAEYARRGFFELVWVVLLALPVILVSHAVLRRESPRAERAWRWLVGVMLVLLGVIAASAMLRMRAYVEAYGLTTDRVYASAFMTWLAIVFAWLAFTVLRGRPRRFAIGALVSGWTVLALLNLAGPDAVIARANLARLRDTGKLDGPHLASLSAEAVPYALAAMPLVSAEARCSMSNTLIDRWHDHPDGDWRNWNRSRAKARTLVAARAAELRTVPCQRTNVAPPVPAAAVTETGAAPAVAPVAP
jgi:hypothetical protein